MYDLFAGSDFCYSSFSVLKGLVWVLGLIWVMWKIKLYFFYSSRLKTLLSFVLNWHSENTKSNIMKEMKGSYILFSGLFILILGMNLWGLFPYMFGVTTQFVLTISLSLVVWLGIVSSSVEFSLIKFLSHMTPQGSPWYLAPILNMMELVSNLIRPLTLALRLGINMTTGHVLMALMSTSSAMSSLTFKPMWVVLIFVVWGYILFELGICFIQGFVFSLLSANYLGEHT